MKVSLSWLKELVNVDISLDELAESLSIAGFEVEEISDLDKRVKGVVVGRLDDVKTHPNADKLKVCDVSIAKGNTVQIVCGANNVKKGAHVFVATPGTYLPSVDITIKSTELRGVLSEGMICSLEELGVPSKAEGIAILEELKLDNIEVGIPCASLLALDDVVIELAITANRPDGMSMIGIAHEVSALTGAKMNPPSISNPTGIELFTPATLSSKAISEFGIYSLHQISGLNGSEEAPKWLKSRIENAGIKSINAIVDITNYVMLEQGQPLHAFDADALEDLVGKPITQTDFGIRQGNNNEEFLALDDHNYKLDDNSQVITCCDVPIAVAGLIGGKKSSVNSSTTRIWLESALFTPTSVRKSSRALGIRTESSSRFEKGISEQVTLLASSRAIDLYKSLFNCNVISRFMDKTLNQEKVFINLRRDRIHSILGQTTASPTQSDNQNSKQKDLRNLEDQEIIDALSLLGCQINAVEKGWNVLPPIHRNSDLKREIDLIEEIARLIGYDKFDANLPDPIRPGTLTPKQQCERKLRSYFAAAGLQEVTTYSLVSDNRERNQVAISNPLLSETSHLRTNLWESHLEICKRNIDSGQSGCWIYEIGYIYNQLDDQIIQTNLLTGMLVGDRRLERWTSSGKVQPLDYYSARGKIHQALSSLNIDIEDKPLTNDPLYHPGRSITMFIEGKLAGKFGALHPKISQQFSAMLDTYFFELKLDPILEAATRSSKWVVSYKDYPTVPSMERDIAVLVDKDIYSIDIIKVIRKVGKPLLEDVKLIDRYEGDNIQSGKVSQAFRLRYRHPVDTLKDTDINPIHNKIREKLTKIFSAELRS